LTYFAAFLFFEADFASSFFCNNFSVIVGFSGGLVIIVVEDLGVGTVDGTVNGEFLLKLFVFLGIFVKFTVCQERYSVYSES
jgi:hypothetical protein